MARLRLAPLFFAAVMPIACAKSGSEHTYLQAADLESSPGFSRDAIVDTPSLTDPLGIDATAIQRLFGRTPYNRPSFLGTYQSNGLRASDAIVKSAIAHKLNPLLFLVRAEMEQGLLGEQFYPSPPSRVEYAFGCGCNGIDKCDAAFAGFDVQVECVARALRKNLDDIAANGVTEGGWGPGVTSTTIDGVKITPRDEATAALYQYTPKVGLGKSGNWLFWNIWQLYAIALQYAGPIGPTGGAFVGDPCRADPNCGFPGGICATNFPGGLCTASCTGDCTMLGGGPDAFCASFQQAGYCLPVCNPTVMASCRDGYSCKKVLKFGSTTESQNVCVVN